MMYSNISWDSPYNLVIKQIQKHHIHFLKINFLEYVKYSTVIQKYIGIQIWFDLIQSTFYGIGTEFCF